MEIDITLLFSCLLYHLGTSLDLSRQQAEKLTCLVYCLHVIDVLIKFFAYNHSIVTRLLVRLIHEDS